MTKKSAGILFYRVYNGKLQVLLVHPGGPFWAKKDIGAWSIPKGEFGEEEEAFAAAKREVLEETGIYAEGDAFKLDAVTQKNNKIVYAWAMKTDFDTANLKSNTFEMEWPPKSGRVKTFPEIDKAGWFNTEEAMQMIIPAQATLITQLLSLL